MITQEQKEKALKFVEAIKNATQSFQPAEIDLAIIYESVFAAADEAKKNEAPDPAA
ncbi:hypothetical protein DAC20_154 [Bacteroides phage DAC20]|nr:hypothetical protein DAC16_149 [Bacteroides phage DAC16]QIG63646.1 hypothetical protein DAC19_155 [Bacteroides phage DAC19]QIG63907.1 hypothetical protein DAC20_154 [Bacteroides phage DAC20]QIG64171.1 hypothetical protein DAC22_157 [Bacteroides phage DAC22]QIG64427.1 hypothetical protein DAC23_149 [Bacteroides phage DAC23]